MVLLLLVLFASVPLGTRVCAQTLTSPTVVSLISTSSSMTLNWNAASGADSYNVYRTTNSNGSGFAAIATGVTSTSYTDNSVTSGQEYWYYVKSVSGSTISTGESVWYGYPFNPPSPITIQPGNGVNVLSWPQTVGAAVYIVDRGTSPGNETSQVGWIGNSSSPSYTDYATNGTTYYYTVSVIAVNAATSSVSVPSSGLAGLPFGPPSSASATDTADGQISLSWTAGAGDAAYNVYRGTVSNGEASTPIASGLSSTSYVDSGLTDGQIYYYKIAAQEGAFVQQSGQASATPVANPGSTLTAGPAAVGNALSWAACPGATNYAVYRGTTSGGESGTSLSNPTTNSYNDTSAAVGVAYYYTVKAYRGSYYSNPSNEASSTAVAVPPAPTGFAAVPGNSLVNLSWNASAGAVSYQIWRGTGTTSLYQTVSSTSYSDTGVSNGTSYNYKIIALNTYGGASSSTSILNVTPIANPTGLAAAPGNAQIVLTWPADTGASGYNIYRGLSSGSESGTALTSVSGATYTYTNTGLTNGTSYFYTIKAKSGTYVSSASNEASAKPNAPPTVATAASASPSPVTGTTTNLSVLGADDGGEAALTYTWTYTGPTGVTFSANGTNAAKNTTATFTQAGSYTFTATITDAGGLSATSSVTVTVSPTLTTISVSPSIANLTLGSAQQFAASANDQFGNALAAQPTITWSTTNVLYGSVDQTGLYTADYATYTDAVVAASGSVSGSASINVANPALPLPDPVTGLLAYPYFFAGSPYVSLGWNYCNWASTHNVYKGTSPGSESSTPIATGIPNGDSGDFYYDSNVVAGGTYYYKVAGVNATGTGPASTEVSVTFPAQPAAPTITPGSVTDTDILVNVSNPAGAVSNNVYLYDSSGSLLQGGPAAFNGSQIDVSGLIPSTPYGVAVTEVDADGVESPLSNTIATMTPAPPVLSGAPTGLTVSSETDSMAYFSWSPVTNADHYVVTCSLTSGGESPGNPGGYSTGTTGAVSDLLANTVYYATAVAYSIDEILSTAPSNEVSFTTLLAPPTNLTAALQGTSVLLNWTDAPVADSYTIFRQIGSGTQTSIGTTSNTTFTDTSTNVVPPGTTITYVVQAITAANHDPGTASTSIVIPTDAPATLAAAGGPQQVTLNWSASRLATGYNVYESQYIGGGEYGYTNVGSSSTTSFVVTGLSSNTQYFFVVTAVYASSAQSVYSPEATATTALAPPIGLVATSGDSTVGLTWNIVSAASGYKVYRMAWGDLTFTNISGSIPLTSASFTDTLVDNGMGYFYVVTDISANGESTYSNVAYAIPSVLEPGTAVLQINSGGPAVGSWLADEYMVNSSYNSIATADTIDTSKVINPGPQSVYQTEDQGYNDLEYSIPGLTPNGSYTIRLHFADWGHLPGSELENISINGVQVATNYDYNEIAGGADRAVVAQFSTNADSSGNIEIYFQAVTGYAHVCGVEILSTSQVPTAPFNLFALPGNTKVALTWTGYAGLTGYNVYRKTAGAGSYTLLTSSPITTAAYADTSVTNGVGYYYVVTAVNASGESRWSNQVYAMPEGVNSLVYRINCGGPAVGLWSADEYYSGSDQTFSTIATPIINGVVNPAPISVYQTFHSASFQGLTYILPHLTPGSQYAIRLHFCDFSDTPNINILNMSINGTAVLTNFDPRAETGVSGETIIPQFNTTADTNGDITIAMSAVLGNPYISGLEVLTDSLPPSQPQQLGAWRGNTHTLLTWLPVAAATGYNIKRSLVSGGPYTTIATDVQGDTYSSATSTAYYYVVTAVNSSGESADSNEAYAEVPFAVTLTPSVLNIGIPGSGFARVTVTSMVGFSGIITYTGSTLPANLGGLLYPVSSTLIPPFEIGAVTTTGTMLQFCVAAGSASATYPVTITAASGDYSANATLNLTVH